MNDEKTLINNLNEGPLLPTLLRFALPLMLANLLQALYNMVDMIIVGQYVGSVGLSAVGIGGQLQMLFLGVGISFASAGQIIISQQIGAKSRSLRDTIGTLLTTELILAVALGLFGILCRTPLLQLVNTPAAAMDDAVGYFMIYCTGMVFVYGYNAVCAILRGMGESKMPMVFIAIASLVNLALDMLFVGGLQMGARGAALATVLAQAIAFAFSVVYLYRHRQEIDFTFRLSSFAIKSNALVALIKLGLPMALQNLMVTVSLTFVNAQVNAVSLTASAVDSVGGKLNSVANIVNGAISVSCATMVGQCFGARNMRRVKQTHAACLAICMTWWVVLSIGYFFFPQQIFGLFTNDAEVIALSVTYGKIAVIWLLSLCSMTPCFSVVEGIGYASFNLIVGILDGVVARIGLTLLLGHFMGLEGYWLGTALAGFTTTILMGIYYHSGRWQNRQAVLKE